MQSHIVKSCYILFTDVEFLPDGLSYYPILFFNDYWNLNQDYMPLNSSTKWVCFASFACFMMKFIHHKGNFSSFVCIAYCFLCHISLCMLFYRMVNLTLMYAPLSMFRWQMYAAQGMRNRWYSVLGEDFIESSDEDQDSLKVWIFISQWLSVIAWNICKCDIFYPGYDQVMIVCLITLWHH